MLLETADSLLALLPSAVMVMVCVLVECLDRSRHMAVVCRDARQKCLQRSACPVFLRVGALIADQTAAECPLQ